MLMHLSKCVRMCCARSEKVSNHYIAPLASCNAVGARADFRFFSLHARLSSRALSQRRSESLLDRVPHSLKLRASATSADTAPSTPQAATPSCSRTQCSRHLLDFVCMSHAASRSTTASGGSYVLQLRKSVYCSPQ